MMRRLSFALLIGLMAYAPTAQATEAPTQPAAERGPVTNLPLPRFVSLKAAEGNVRRGPSRTHRVDWVFKRRNMPLQVVSEYGHWRRVVDRDGAGGWMHYSLLSGARTALVTLDKLPLHARPDASTRVIAYAQEGVVARLGECADGWCEVRISGIEGWSPMAHLWGAGAPAP